MNLLPGATRLTADGLVGTSGKPIRVFAVHLVSGATASTTTLKLGTSTAGTAYLQVDGLASQGVTINIAGGLRFPTGCYMDTDANISYCVIVYTEEQ
jgi:hypothetical protein